MSKESPTTYRIGSIGEFAAWTREVVRDGAAAGFQPKKWFDTERTADRAAVHISTDFANPSDRRKCLLACLARAKGNSRKKGIAFDLTPEFVESLWNDGLCAVTGVQFNLKEYPNARVKHPFAPSIDRTLSSGGYTRDNVRLVCAAVNFGLGQYGDEVFLKLAQGAVEHQRQIAALAADADWQAAYRERIAAAEELLAISPETERRKQRQRIAGLKRALTLGPDGLRAAAAKAKANRKQAPV
jgi:hypothetical protein